MFIFIPYVLLFSILTHLPIIFVLTVLPITFFYSYIVVDMIEFDVTVIKVKDIASFKH